MVFFKKWDQKVIATLMAESGRLMILGDGKRLDKLELKVTVAFNKNSKKLCVYDYESTMQIFQFGEVERA